MRLSDLFPRGSFPNLISRNFELLEWSREQIFNRTPSLPMLMNHTFRFEENVRKPMADHFNETKTLNMTEEFYNEQVDLFMRFNMEALNNHYDCSPFHPTNPLEAEHRQHFKDLWGAYMQTRIHDPEKCKMCSGHLPQFCEDRKG